jgi:GrpB-like predicted nucleotidyltransferase (UPF0157 family)
MLQRFWKQESPIGLPDDRVRVEPYTPVWARLYYEESVRLWAALRGLAVDIQHVGSTAVRGLPAKPILDICLAIRDYNTAMRCVQRLEGLGYEYQGENHELRQHRFVKGRPTAYHLYLVEAGSEIMTRGTRLRDYLVQHPDVARAYSDLKRQLARQFPADRRAYQEAKMAYADQAIDVDTDRPSGEVVQRRRRPGKLGTLHLGLGLTAVSLMVLVLSPSVSLLPYGAIVPVPFLAVGVWLVIEGTKRNDRAVRTLWEDSTATTATCLARHLGEYEDEYGRTSYSYYVTVRYQAGQEDVLLEAPVDKNTYDTLHLRRTLPIRYANADPRIALLGNEIHP